MFGQAVDKRLTLLEERFMRHMDNEEVMMGALKANSKEQTEKLDRLCDTVAEFSEMLKIDTLQTEIKIARAQEETRDHVKAHYATKKDLDEGLNSIRESAKLIWGTLLACVAVIAWFIDKLL